MFWFFPAQAAMGLLFVYARETVVVGWLSLRVDQHARQKSGFGYVNQGNYIVYSRAFFGDNARINKGLRHEQEHDFDLPTFPIGSRRRNRAGLV
jgi:hypothetical protein